MLSLVCFHECFAYYTSMHSYICIVAPHLGMLDAPREGRDVGAKPEDGVWISIQKIGGLRKCQDGRYSPCECHHTDLVLDPRQAPEHNNPPTLRKQLSIYVIYVLFH
jgi:hypothetical protein